MLTIERKLPATPAARRGLLTLENGDSLDSREFLRRFETMPELKKAELIKGRVFMGSPVRADIHGQPDNLLQTWFGNYVAHTPGVVCYTNTTLIIDPRNTFQPDAMLCVQPTGQGQAKLSAQGYLHGVPELVAEVAASSASIDARDKLDVYRRAGVQEYILWRTADDELDWFVLESEKYLRLGADAHGLVRSRAFPGLTLARPALLKLDLAAVLAALADGLKSTAHAKFVNRLKAKAK